MNLRYIVCLIALGLTKNILYSLLSLFFFEFWRMNDTSIWDFRRFSKIYLIGPLFHLALMCLGYLGRKKCTCFSSKGCLDTSTY